MLCPAVGALHRVVALGLARSTTSDHRVATTHTLAPVLTPGLMRVLVVKLVKLVQTPRSANSRPRRMMCVHAAVALRRAQHVCPSSRCLLCGRRC